MMYCLELMLQNSTILLSTTRMRLPFHVRHRPWFDTGYPILRCPYKECFLLVYLVNNTVPAELVPNRTSQSFCRRRAVQHQATVAKPVLFPGGPDSLPQRKEHRRAQEQRWLADPLAARDRPQVLPADRVALGIILQHADVELTRNVAESRDLVRSWAGCRQTAGLGIPQGFFEGEETLALDECSFDLAVIETGVDGVSNILSQVSINFHSKCKLSQTYHHDVCSQHVVVTGQDVQFDFSDRYTLRPVVIHGLRVKVLKFVPDISNPRHFYSVCQYCRARGFSKVTLLTPEPACDQAHAVTICSHRQLLHGGVRTQLLTVGL